MIGNLHECGPPAESSKAGRGIRSRWWSGEIKDPDRRCQGKREERAARFSYHSPCGKVPKQVSPAKSRVRIQRKNVKPTVPSCGSSGTVDVDHHFLAWYFSYVVDKNHADALFFSPFSLFFPSTIQKDSNDPWCQTHFPEQDEKIFLSNHHTIHRSLNILIG